ncbi:hypothetical protein HNP73_000101 [Amaricoccus macauensis]|uniref:Uncharacterized protein n=1 Tax=Amaricoccus macauensis TaxID=57001 RepID=A0A840SHF1_9RHOB|nr:hypothetical protein [Amaricoccus macauensis]
MVADAADIVPAIVRPRDGASDVEAPDLAGRVLQGQWGAVLGRAQPDVR